MYPVPGVPGTRIEIPRNSYPFRRKGAGSVRDALRGTKANPSYNPLHFYKQRGRLTDDSHCLRTVTV
eukprot:3409898-Rhodomonas_salina.1